MARLYTIKQFSQAKKNDYLQLRCDCCKKKYRVQKRCVPKLNEKAYCSQRCRALGTEVTHTLRCANCGKKVTRTRTQIRNSVSGNVFCNNSCSATYNNKQRKDYTGTNHQHLNICNTCGTPYIYTTRKVAQYKQLYQYCSAKCKPIVDYPLIMCSCEICGITFTKTPLNYKNTLHHLCSERCQTEYDNRLNDRLDNRSDLIKELNERLNLEFSDLNILYSDDSIIQGGVDIYIPSLKIAFELHDKSHFEPITSKEDFINIQKNDNDKKIKCDINNIKLFIIDTRKYTDLSSELYNTVEETIYMSMM